MKSAYSAQFDHTWFIYNTDFLYIKYIETIFQNYSFRLNFFSNEKLGIGTSFAQVKKDLNTVRNWPSVFKWILKPSA